MRVIKPGIKPENKIATVSCHDCNCKYEFAVHEGRFVSDRDGDAIVINCPQCSKEEWVNITLFQNPPTK